MNSCSIRPGLRYARIFAAVAGMGLCAPALADQLQNAAVAADPGALAAYGFATFGKFGPLNGQLVTVGMVEAGGGIANTTGPNKNTTPGSTLPNGNPDLPFTSVKLTQFPGGVLPAGGIPAAMGLVVTNHATEVAGVLVGEGATDSRDTGIATGASVLESGIIGSQTSDMVTGVTGYDNTIQTAIQQGSSIINLSLGSDLASSRLKNDGSFPGTLFTDWAVTRYNSLIVIAGNERPLEIDTPADSFNGIVVGGTTASTNYDQAAVQLNVSLTGTLTANQTADGRIGVSLVAPGGDTGSTPSTTTTFVNLPTFNSTTTNLACTQLKNNRSM